MAWYFILLIVIISITLIYFLGLFAIINIAFYKPRFIAAKPNNKKLDLIKMHKDISTAISNYTNVPHQDVYIQSNKLKLHGVFYNQHSNYSVIIHHGYCASIKYRMMDLPYYYEKGFNVLMVDLRTHGKSEGNYITLGALESLDTIEWTKWLSNATNNSKIILDGVSMGAATVLNCTGNPNLPNNVVGVVSDCSFTSPIAVCRHIIYGKHKYIGRPTLKLTEYYAKLFFHYNMEKDAPIENVKKAKIPALFIHGDKDNFVPTNMVNELYDNYNGPKTKVITKDVGHAFSTTMQTKVVHQALDKFIGDIIQ